MHELQKEETMRSPERNAWRVLVPYDVREGMRLAKAAEVAGKSQSTVRSWCIAHGIGRRIGGGGAWIVSKVALAMFLDGDGKALAAYRSGDRVSALVKTYFQRCGVPLPTFIPATSTTSVEVAGLT